MRLPARTTPAHPRAILRWALIACDFAGVNLGFAGSYALLYPKLAEEYLPPQLGTLAVFLIALNVASALIFAAYRLYAIKRATSRVHDAYTIFVADRKSVV